MAGLIKKTIQGFDLAKEVVKLAKETGKKQSEVIENAKENIAKKEELTKLPNKEESETD